MTREELFVEKEAKSNKIIVNGIMVMDLCMLLIWVINMLGIFVLENERFTYVIIILLLISFIPVILVYLFKIKGKYVKYLLIFLGTFLMGTAYAFLTYHALILFVFPIVYASLYYSKKVIYFTEVTTLVIMLASHIAAPYIGMVFDGFLLTLKSSILYGFIPRAVLYACIGPIVVRFTGVLADNINKEVDYTLEIQRSKEGIEKILNETNYVVETKTLEESMGKVAIAIVNIVSFLVDEKDIDVIMGIKLPGANYRYMNQKMVDLSDSCSVKEGCININDLNEKVSIPVYTQEGNGEILFCENYYLMTLYSDKLLNCFIKVNVDIKDDDYTAKDVLTLLFDTIKIDITNVLIFEEMNITQEMLIYSLSDVSEFKTWSARKHIRRLSEYMKILGREICSDEEDYRALYIAVMLHDIGKLVIPSSILDKPDKLTQEEYQTVKKHALFGGELLSNAPGKTMNIAKQIARNHHERWDGKGYRGLKGEQIDLYSQCTAVLDVFDALISKKSYREAWNVKDAYNEIIKNRGTQFSPRAVDLFTENFNKIEEVIKRYPDND